MSLILDALKKSEAERRRGQLPAFDGQNVMVLPPSTRKSNAAIIIAISALILLCASMAFYFWSRPSDTLESLANNPNALPATDFSNPSPAATTKPVNTIDAHRLASKVSKPVDVAASAKPLVITAKPVLEIPRPKPVPEPTPAPLPENTVSIPPSISSLSTDARQQLPAMKLSMHVYANEAGKRFAIMDGERINEGSMIGNAVVERISPEGVIVSIQGKTYLVPRP
jgi:general secretion pathway protein B